MAPLIRDIAIPAGNRQTACELLAVATALSRARIKDAMAKGAVWLLSGKKRRRLRRASMVPRPGDKLTIFYDEALLALVPPRPGLVHDAGHYSVWHKPAGLMSQGTDHGDHCSLLRQAEIHFRSTRPVFAVHRLDRETEGLMLVAHSKEAAARLSLLFQQHRIDKRYLVEVRGDLRERPGNVIDLPLDDKPAHSAYEILSFDEAANTSRALVRISSGRLHQIRRHFHLIGFPVMGDPRYGSGNKNRAGLRLVALELSFTCPFTNREICFSLPLENWTRPE
ncbi:MAG: RluA family pseudouridine synthase [Thermodesulfobacteriota bacterium]